MRQQFVGLWRNSGGQMTESCGAAAARMTTLTPNELQITITAGVASPTVTLSFADPTGCTVDATVSGNSATLAADTSCGVPFSGTTITFKSGGTFTTTDGETLNGNFVDVSDDGQGTACTQTNVVPFSH